MRVIDAEVAGGVVRVRVAVPGLFAGPDGPIDGVRVVELPREALRGKTAAERMEAIADALDEDPIEGVRGAEVARPLPTRVLLEAKLDAPYARWRRWQATRIEAEARGMGAVITALRAREDAAWAAYAQAIQEWRAAP